MSYTIYHHYKEKEGRSKVRKVRDKEKERGRGRGEGGESEQELASRTPKDTVPKTKVSYRNFR